MKLSAAIVRKLEFDEEAARKYKRSCLPPYDGGVVRAAMWERARTASIDQLVPEMVEALELFRGYCTEAEAPYPMKFSAEVLAKLSKAVGAKT